MFTQGQVKVITFVSTDEAIQALGALRKRFPTVTTEVLGTSIMLGKHQPELNYRERMLDFLAKHFAKN